MTYRDISNEWRGSVGQHRGGSHHCVAGAHGLHIHVRRVGAADSFMRHILRVWRPWGQGLKSGRSRLREPASTQCPLLCHCGSRNLHVKTGRTCGEKEITELQAPPEMVPKDTKTTEESSYPLCCRSPGADGAVPPRMGTRRPEWVSIYLQ